MLADQVDYVVGVDTHRDEHVLAVVTAPAGVVVAQRSVPAGDRGLLGRIIGNQGAVMARLGENEKATALTEEAYRLARGVGDVFMSGMALSNLAADALREEGLRDRPREAERVARACPAH